MILSGTFTFDGPRARVWEILQDPAVLAKALPGTKSLRQVGDDRYRRHDESERRSHERR